MRLLLFSFSFFYLMFSSTAQELEESDHFNVNLDFETRTSILLSKMTLKEKISQLGNNAPAIPRLGVLEYNWWNECLHGVARAGTATVFPQAIGMAATFNPNLINDVAVVISDEARAKHHEALRNNDYSQYKGLTFWSPNINIFRDPRWGRGHETYGEDPYLTGQIGTQFVKGLQGNDPKYLKLVATAKHFAVHSGPESERHFFNANVNQRDLWETYLPAFKDLVVDANVYSVMGAYNRVNGESASASNYLLQEILRDKWGFNGYVVSDCGAINDIHANHKIVKTPEESAALGVITGCDLNCGGIYQNHLQESVTLGLISEKEIDTAVYRLFLARMKLGMFDPAEIVSYAQIPFDINNSQKHDELSLKTAQSSMTLLKNNGVLPIDINKINKIAVVGPNADNINALLGNYHGTPSSPVTFINGLNDYVGKRAEITYSKGVDLVKDGARGSNLLSDSIIEDVKKADLAIFVGGLDATWEGEEMPGGINVDGFYNGDRTRIEMPEIQQKAIKAMIDTGTPVVLVLMAGSSIALSGLEKELDAILMAWYPGQRGGDATTSVLFGDYNPGGKLPVTFYSSTSELPDFKDYNMSSGNGFTYRYYKGKALYPFGHGLSYTKFKYSKLKVNKIRLTEKEKFKISFTIKNIGNYNGDEVVQVYIKDLNSEFQMPIKQLRSFERISLNKKDEKIIEFEFTPIKDLRYYNSTKQKYMVEKGSFEIQVGSSSEDIRLKKIIYVD
ncbi:glycoside hydrolase family 3 C-terminal domain-containing protein [Flavobacteriaceae bacterium]|nr:glycoside hydrolase family 3 C-terminal domain-containing protein [bacterium]MDB4180074.1 glycoside hydrolase family 3 C-terminal domain-containing protein [Flavobacteriaceae bacterium]MDC0496800.1 glycoside hydrolase family 3 C-terminal domain-containing protein [Flavobacteriaceae bacterium]